MSWLTDQYDKAVENDSVFKRKKWDPVGEADTYLNKKFGYESSDDLEEQGPINPNMSAGEVDPDAKLGPLQNLAKESKGRKFHNINKQGASILTS